MKTRKKSNGAKHSARVTAARKKRAKEGADAVKKARRDAHPGTGRARVSRQRYFLDTEFVEAPFHLDPISVALVCEDGREFYAINSECDHTRADPWVVKHVLAKLPPRSDPRWMTKVEIAARLRAFVASGIGAPEFWGYFADYDWVLFCWLLGGRMIDLPAGWPMFCMDLKQVMVERGISRDALPPDPPDAHDALVDARWLALASHIVMKGGGGA